MDAGCEYVVVGFGTWTVLYHLGCWLGLPTTPLLLATVALTAAIALLSTRVTGTLGRTRRRGGVRHRAWPFLAVSAVLAVGASAALTGADTDYPLGWWLALGSVASLVALLVWEGPVEEEPVEEEPAAADRVEGAAGNAPEPMLPPTRPLARTASSVVVLLVAVAGGVLTLFVRNVSFDDVFYVNKAVFVAEHGTIPMRDTIYTDQVLPAIRGAGTVPVQSFEVFQGAVAHVLGISGGTVVYLLTPPVVIALCVWVMWWLARTWSSGPALAAFAVAVAYLTFGIYVEPGAEGSIAMSSIPLRAAWQGKVVLLCVALPMAYLALSRWALHRRLRDLVLVVAVGAAAVGLSSTAAFLVPPVALAAAFALLLTRRPGWLGALALGAYPLGAGLVASALGDGAGYGELLRTAPEAYHGVLGRGPWGWLGSLALLLGAWGVRRGAARSVAAAAAVGAVVLLAPFMPELVQDVTGAGPLVWRLPWIIPVPVLLGVLAAAPVAVARGWPAAFRGVGATARDAVRRPSGAGLGPARRRARRRRRDRAHGVGPVEPERDGVATGMEVPCRRAGPGRAGRRTGAGPRRARARPAAGDECHGADDDRRARRGPPVLLPAQHRRGPRPERRAATAQQRHATRAGDQGPSDVRHRPRPAGGAARLPRRQTGRRG